MSRRILIAFMFLAAPIALAAQLQQPPTFPAPAVGASTTALYQLFHDYWEWRLAESPELATQVGRTDLNDRWRDWSRAARDRARAARREFLEQVLYIGTGNLTSADRLSAHLLEHELRTELDAEPYSQLVTRLSQQNGAHNQVFNTIDQMPARSVKDYQNIIARLRALPVYVDQTIDLWREQLAAGRAQPPVVVDLVLAQIRAQAARPPAGSPLLGAFRRFPAEIAGPERERLVAQAQAAYAEYFVPGWQRLERFLSDEYRPKARAGIGLSSMTGGTEAYRTLVRTYTTVGMTPEQIHELGLQEVARIEKEMERIAREAGFFGPATAYEAQLRSRPDQRYSSQEEMLAAARDILTRLEPEIPRLFRRLPRAVVGVRPIGPDREASSASNYSPGTPDGSRQAWFNMNTYQPREQVRYVTEALVLHETVPGHHLQVGLARELQGIPEFRRALSVTAFSEGWALYAESLGRELGPVYREPSTRFGQLASEKFRAVRLVVDTGIHALGWSRERAREYFALHVPGQSIAEVDRYISWPGQALAYKLGELKIKALRTRAEQQLGPRFDLRDFHEAVLRNGPLPLDLLEEQVDAYIAAATN
jgi:prolyl oligopeptidase